MAARASLPELEALLRDTLVVWRLSGDVVAEGDRLVVSAAGRTVRVLAAPDDALFAWFVETAEKTRGAVSIAALLRTLRNTLDPEHAGSRLRLAPGPVLPS